VARIATVKKRELLDRYVRAWNEQDAEGITRIWTDDAVRVSPMGQAKGPQAITEACQRFWMAASDSKITVFDYAESDNKILYSFTDKGSHTGPLMTSKGPMEGSGRPFSLDGMAIIEVSGDGHFRSEHMYFDTLALFRQLGLA
jgi:steroid delta-isomerase-like uncharacterized protein